MKGQMVVLRLIGDEWSWEDRIALAVPPQKSFTMCIPLLVSKLGLERWNGLVLYKTEGRPPKYCRATIPLDMASNPQRERLKDGSVLWVRVAPSLVQQGRDRVFQKSLEEWREKNGVKGIADDGSDVKRFIEELSSRLNSSDSKELNALEREGRDAIEGEENRQFFTLTYARQVGEKLRLLETDEDVQRRLLEKACAVAAERHKRSMLLWMQQMEVSRLEALEERNRCALLEEQKGVFENHLQRVQEFMRVHAVGERIPVSNLDPATQTPRQEMDEGQFQERSATECNDVAELQSIVRVELQRLLKPMEQMYHEEFSALQRQQEAEASENKRFLAHLRQYVSTVLRIVHREAWRPGPLPPAAEPTLDGMAKIKLALEEQQGLLTELLRGYQGLDMQTSADLHTTSARTILSAVNSTQLNMCRYLDSLLENLSVLQSSWRAGRATMEEAQGDVSRAERGDKSGDDAMAAEQDSPAYHPHAKVFFTVGNRCRTSGHGKGFSSVHPDSYNMLVAFLLQCTKLLSEGSHRSAEDVKAFLDDLLLECGSVQAAVDELCLAHNVVSHPMRVRFLREAEIHAPHLCSLVDIMLHLYTGREVELLLWMRPELSSRGGFTSCEDATNGGVYYYHTAAGLSQWVSPAPVEDTTKEASTLW